MNDIVVSIIVPVYKAEKYLSRCVGSILEQTFTDFELILVDDGSPDKSGELCDKYSKKDSRIKVIHKENGGVSSARNAGLGVAKGKYITFVDSDDWVAENYLGALVEPMKQYDVQLVVGSHEARGLRVVGQNLKTRLINFSELSEREKVTAYTQNLYGPTTKMFMSSIINQNNMRFKQGVQYGEDTLFVRSYLRFCKSIYSVGGIIYFYNRLNDESLSRRLDKKRGQWTLYLIEDLYSMLDEVGISETYRNKIVSSQAFDYFFYYTWFVSSVPKQILIEEIKNWLETFEKYLILDLYWAKKEDSYMALRQAVLGGDCNEIYDACYEVFKKNRLRKLKHIMKEYVLRPYLERRRDGVNKYKYLDK